jgi:hypothetical protein
VWSSHDGDECVRLTRTPLLHDRRLAWQAERPNKEANAGLAGAKLKVRLTDLGGT